MKIIRSISIAMLVAITLSTAATTAANADVNVANTVLVKALKISGATVFQYNMPDGSTVSVPQWPKGFDLTKIAELDLGRIGLPARPKLSDQLVDWLASYSKVNLGAAPAPEVQVDATAHYANITSTNWGGYAVGNMASTSKQYVAVKGNFAAPKISSPCTAASQAIQGVWVGLGGTNGSAKDLLQQGIGWCNPVNSRGTWQPWYEFANNFMPVHFCGFTSWYISPGDVVYNNVSYQTSNNTAFFYMEDQTTGIAHSCAVTRPSGWGFTGNTAECISEKASTILPNFGTLTMSNCQAQLASNSRWQPFGSADVQNKLINGIPGTAIQFQNTGPLSSDGKTFSMTFVRAG